MKTLLPLIAAFTLSTTQLCAQNPVKIKPKELVYNVKTDDGSHRKVWRAMTTNGDTILTDTTRQQGLVQETQQKIYDRKGLRFSQRQIVTPERSMVLVHTFDRGEQDKTKPEWVTYPLLPEAGTGSLTIPRLQQ